MLFVKIPAKSQTFVGSVMQRFLVCTHFTFHHYALVLLCDKKIKVMSQKFLSAPIFFSFLHKNGNQLIVAQVHGKKKTYLMFCFAFFWFVFLYPPIMQITDYSLALEKQHNCNANTESGSPGGFLLSPSTCS